MAISDACPTTALCLLAIFIDCTTADANPANVPAQKNRIVIGADTLLDGRGDVLRDMRIGIEGSKIVALVFVMKGGVVYKDVPRGAVPPQVGVQP